MNALLFSQVNPVSPSPRQVQNPRRKQRGSRRDHHQTVAENERSIEEVYAGYVARNPDHGGRPIGSIYARYSSDFQSSVGDQVRALLAESERRGFHIPRELIFVDYAVTGRRRSRPGLDQLRQALANRRCRVLLVLALNRLFRNLRACLEFIDDSILANQARCIIVDRGIDTADGNQWKMSLPIGALMDEQAATAHVASIRAAHVRLAEDGDQCGSIPVGYRSIDEVGEPSRVHIDSAGAECIRKIFHWFVVDGLSIRAIVRRLNADKTMPTPPLSDGQWSENSVRRALKNRRYIGDWSYGRTERQWVRESDYARAIERAEPLRAIVDESLRIVDDHLFLSAASRLESNVGDHGRKNSEGVRNPVTHLLSGLLYCKEHDQRMHRAGPNGDVYYVCPVCQRLETPDRALFTLLDGKITIACLAQELKKRLLEDANLVDQVIDACVEAELRQQRPDETRITQLTSQVSRITTQIDFNLRNLGDTLDDQRQSESVLRQLRSKRAKVQTELASLRAAATQVVIVPTRNEVLESIDTIASAMDLVVAADSPAEEVLELTKEIFRQFTGGRIVLTQEGERVKHRGWLRGEFQTSVTGWLAREVGNVIDLGNCRVKPIAVDFIRPSEDEKLAGSIIELRRKDMTFKLIARELKLGRNRVSALFREFAPTLAPDLQVEEGKRAKKKYASPRLFQRSADEVKRLFDEGKQMGEIAEILKLDRNTGTKSFRYWYRSRGLPPPNTRKRGSQDGNNLSPKSSLQQCQGKPVWPREPWEVKLLMQSTHQPGLSLYRTNRSYEVLVLLLSYPLVRPGVPAKQLAGKYT